jgi:hypothetical protein
MGEGGGDQRPPLDVLGKADAGPSGFERDHLAETAGIGGAHVEGHVRHLDVA